MAGPVHNAHLGWQNLVQDRSGMARIDGTRIQLELARVGIVLRKHSASLGSAKAGVLDPLLRQLLIHQLHRKFRVTLDVVVGTLAGAHNNRRPGVNLDIAGVRKDVAVFGCVVVQARADADHEIRIRE